MTLTEKQRSFFNCFGFLKFPGLFADDIEEITAQFHTVFKEFDGDAVNWVHETHENRLRRFITDATEKSSYLASMLDDPRITGIATEILGSGYGFRGSDVSIYDCGTTFHQDGIDTAKPGSKNIKMALYLDEVDENSGALRIIPGSHHKGDKFFGMLFQNWLGPDALELTTEEYPAATIPSSPGDLLLWDYKIMHATAYAGNQRRMLALEFAQAS